MIDKLIRKIKNGMTEKIRKEKREKFINEAIDEGYKREERNGNYRIPYPTVPFMYRLSFAFF